MADSNFSNRNGKSSKMLCRGKVICGGGNLRDWGVQKPIYWIEAWKPLFINNKKLPTGLTIFTIWKHLSVAIKYIFRVDLRAESFQVTALEQSLEQERAVLCPLSPHHIRSVTPGSPPLPPTTIFYSVPGCSAPACLWCVKTCKCPRGFTLYWINNVINQRVHLFLQPWHQLFNSACFLQSGKVSCLNIFWKCYSVL